MLPLTWCACYFPKIIILRFEVISEKIRKNPVNTEKTFSMYYNALQGAMYLLAWTHFGWGTPGLRSWKVGIKLCAGRG
jgi:hypothetical protein